MRGHWEPDHTKPTIAFLALVVVAAATIGSNLSRGGADVVSATEQPGRGAVATPSPPAGRETPQPSASSAFAMGAVVTLAPRDDTAPEPAPPTVANVDRAGTTPSTGQATSVAGSGPGGATGSASSATRPGRSGDGSAGGGGAAASADTGPGRSDQSSGSAGPPGEAGDKARDKPARKSPGEGAGKDPGAGSTGR